MTQQHYDEISGKSASENYERYFVSSIGAPLASDLVDIAALRPGERVLDVACGTGVVARLASKRVGPAGSVAGLDVNSGMLSVAASAMPPDVSIEWHEASAEAMPLTNASFDVVLCQMGLQFVPDKRAALREIYRVLASDGRLLLNLPGPTPQPLAIIGDALARHVNAEAKGFVNQVFSLHDIGDIKRLIEGVGFVDVSVQAYTKSLHLPAPAEFLWQYVHSTPLSVMVAQVDEDHRGSLERDVVERCQKFEKDGSLMLQVRVVVAIARKQSSGR